MKIKNIWKKSPMKANTAEHSTLKLVLKDTNDEQKYVVRMINIILLASPIILLILYHDSATINC
jgi:hypothetical protein